nr:uncharacterized protein LOC104652916 [Saimiri boliviensis boliviensis]
MALQIMRRFFCHLLCRENSFLRLMTGQWWGGFLKKESSGLDCAQDACILPFLSDELLRKEVPGGPVDVRALPTLLTSGGARKYSRHNFGEENAKGLQKETASARFSRRGTATC